MLKEICTFGSDTAITFGNPSIERICPNLDICGSGFYSPDKPPVNDPIENILTEIILNLDLTPKDYVAIILMIFAFEPDYVFSIIDQIFSIYSEFNSFLNETIFQ